MKLNSARISEFQSIRDSNPFEIGDITCLVGKNEAGKTALLRALYRMNPIIASEGNFDATEDYPRADVEDYRQDIEAKKREPANVVEATFALSDLEIQSIESEFEEGILTKAELTLTKGYDNHLKAQLPINESVAVKSFIKQAQLPSQLEQDLQSAVSLDELSRLADLNRQPEDKEYIDKLKTILKKVADSKGLSEYLFNKFLSPSMPKFMYFGEYFMMTGAENIESLKARQQQNKLKDSDYPLLGLIELARLKLDELINPQKTEELVNKLEGAGNHLSKRVLKYWSQNKHLSMEFDVRPARPNDPIEIMQGVQGQNNIWARVHDSKRKVSTRLGTRSRGFVWFFSFLAWFDQQQRKNEPLILLLDEPGLYLHGRAQGDLLDYIEKELKGNHQVIYTTHSPFMVDVKKFERIRIVQDKSMDTDEELPQDQDGTKVITEIFEATDDSLFPLQGALGYNLSQTLFVGPNCLVVEGVSDLLYIQTISSLLENQNKEKLNEKWTITPVGGADKIPTFVALLGAQKDLNIATLIDIQKKDKQSIENLYKKKLLSKNKVFTFADFTNTAEADIEDMFETDFYTSLVNSEYEKELGNPIESEKLNQALPRLLVRIESSLMEKPMKSGHQFSHYRPARYFAENISLLKGEISKKTLDRFEKAFQALNALL